MTVVYKFIFPAVWIGLFGFGTVAVLLGNQPEKRIFLAVLIIGTSVIGWLCFPLKRISIEGSDLIISNFRRECRVPLSNISDVTENVMINIHPVWIHFRRPTEFGQKIMFMPTARMFAFFSTHPIVAELKRLSQGGMIQQHPPPLRPAREEGGRVVG